MIANRYQLLEQLGAGGMGIVYTAIDRLTQNTLALKRVNVSPDQLQFTASNTTDDHHRSLAIEFRTLAGLRHPNIISVLDYGFDDAIQPFFTMELLTDARPITEAAKGQSTATQIRLINEMLLALSYLHRRGVIHRDLKPDNVLVTADQQVKVLDFGIAVATSKQEQSVAGSIAYMAPELLMEIGASVQSDLYAAGMIIYEILTGCYPFERTNMPLLLNDILHTVPNTSSLDGAVATLLNRILSKSPSERPINADDTIRDLCQASEQPIPTDSQTIREGFLQASRFVGRDTELDHLNAVLNGVLDGENAFYLIGGESGVGKSRLVDELRTQALVKGATVLIGQGVEGGGLPYQMWLNPARRLVLSSKLSDLEAGILKDIIPDISVLLERDIPDAPVVTGNAYQQRLVLTLVELFKRHLNTIVLVLEDLQWAIESLEPLKQMLKVKEQLPGFFVIGTYRSDENLNLSDTLTGMQTITLNRLDEFAISELSASMLGDIGKMPEIVDLIQRETEGNAFFMVEVVRELAKDVDRLSDIGLKTLPASLVVGEIQQIVQKRLQRLPEAILQWLKLVAIAGRELDLDVAFRLGQNASSVESYLSQCADAAVLELVDSNWRFNHDKIREGVLIDLSETEKPDLHRAVAQAIESAHPDDANYSEVLLEHWRQAGDLDKEIYYLTLVADDMILVRNELEQARILAESGLARLSKDDGRRIDLLNIHSSAFSNLIGSENDLAIVSARQALELAEQLQDQAGIAKSLTRLAIKFSHKEEFELSQRYFQQSLDVSQTIGDQALIVKNLHHLGQLYWNNRNFELSQKYFQESLEASQLIGDQYHMSISLDGIGKSLTRIGKPEQAQTYYEQALAIKRTIGYSAEIIRTTGLLGLMEHDQKHYDQAIAYHEQAVEISRNAGDGFYIAISLANLAASLVGKEDYEQAQTYYEEALAISQKANNHYLIAYIFEGLAGVKQHQGLIQERIAYLELALDAFRSAGGWQSNANVSRGLHLLGVLYLQVGDSRAQKSFYDSLALAYEHKLLDNLLEPLAGFAHLYVLANQMVKAAELISLIQNHSALNDTVKAFLDDFVPDFEQELTSEELQEAIERGKTLDPNAVAERLLQEFADTE